MNELDQHLDRQGPDLTNPDAREKWEGVHDDAMADWALRKIAHATTERARLRQLAEQRIDDIRGWLEVATRPLDHDIEFFTHHLIQYRRELEDQDPKLAKTYKLPSGALKRRAGRDRTVVVDQQAFTAWALDNLPEALKIDPRVSALTDDRFAPNVIDGEGGHLFDTDTGAMVPGVEVIEGVDTYTVAAELPRSDEF